MADDSDNRALLLAAALGLFSERGYEAVGVAEIAEAAGVTKPTLYHYFGSKRGLLDAILEGKGGDLLASVRAAARYDHDVPLGLERIGLALARFTRGEPGFARLRLALSVAPPASEAYEAARALNEGLFAALEGFFRAAAADHGNMKGRSRAYAASFLGTFDGYAARQLAGAAPLDDRAAREALRQFMYGIFS